MTQGEDLRFQNSEPRIHSTAQLKASKLGRYADIGERVILREVTVGDFTYFERNGEGFTPILESSARLRPMCGSTHLSIRWSG